MLAGALRRCGPQAPRTAPVSRSATSQDRALRVPGTGGAPAGTARPAVSRSGPPTGGASGACAGATVGGGCGRGEVFGSIGQRWYGTVAAGGLTSGVGVGVGSTTAGSARPAPTTAARKGWRGTP